MFFADITRTIIAVKAQTWMGAVSRIFAAVFTSLNFNNFTERLLAAGDVDRSEPLRLRRWPAQLREYEKD